MSPDIHSEDTEIMSRLGLVSANGALTLTVDKFFLALLMARAQGEKRAPVVRPWAPPLADREGEP